MTLKLDRIIFLSVCLMCIVAKSNLRSGRESTPSDSPINHLDAQKTVETYIRDYGYPFEHHWVTTSDGYILNVWRIPCRRAEGDKCTPILFQHGIFDTAFSFLFLHIGENLPMKLWQEGYDIWLGNVRGNRYSMNHTTLNPKDFSGPFWDFSYDEMAKIDLPTMLDYIKNQTDCDKIKYVCHSQGCVMMVALAALDPYYVNKMVNTTLAFAPAVYLQYAHSAGITSAKWLQLIKNYRDTGVKNVMGDVTWYTLSAFTAAAFPALWLDTIYAFTGAVNHPDIDHGRLAVVGAHLPGGTSLQDLDHFMQACKTQFFMMYDYGSPRKNQEKYKQDTPPRYEMIRLGALNMRWRVVYGQKDALITPQAVGDLLVYLKHPYRDNLEIQEVPDASHLDVYWSNFAISSVFPQAIEFIENSDRPWSNSHNTQTQ